MTFTMNFHDGAPLLARTIRLREEEGRSELELTNGEMVIWTGSGALAIGRQLEASIKAGEIRNLLVPSPEGGQALEIHVGPDVSIEHVTGKSEGQ